MTRLVAAALIASMLGVASATAKPDGDIRIRHGAGIGPIKLGMTYAQVRKILGGPQTVDRRETLRNGRHYLEFGWDFSWWTVGFY
jgi:outer membrane protein assembly factor BamE (lipoprotein component of BamABCDE complex)